MATRGRVITPMPYRISRGVGGVGGRARELTRVSKGGNNDQIIEFLRRSPVVGGTDGSDEADIPFAICPVGQLDISKQFFIEFSLLVIGGADPDHWTLFRINGGGMGEEADYFGLSSLEFPDPSKNLILSYKLNTPDPDIVPSGFIMYDPETGSQPLRNAFKQNVLVEPFICPLDLLDSAPA